MFLFVLLLITNAFYASDNRDLSSICAVGSHVIMAARSSSVSEDELCDAALEAFMRKSGSDVSRYIKPHLASVIKEVSSSPDSDSDSDSPSPKRIIRTWVKQPESVKNTPRTELDEIVLSAVLKAFEEKESILANKEKKIEGMFSKKQAAVLTTVVGAIVTVVSSLGGVYGTLDSINNCTK